MCVGTTSCSPRNEIRPIDGLHQYLDDRRMLKYEREVCQWCSSSGAAFLEEVIENWDDLANHLSLSVDERLRVSDRNCCNQENAACHIPGLHEYLDERHMLKYEYEVHEWCLSNGAAFLQEVIKNWADLVEHLPVSPDEAWSCSGSIDGSGNHTQPEVQFANGENIAHERIRTWLSKHNTLRQEGFSPGAEATHLESALTIGHLPTIPEAESLTYSSTV